MIVERIHKWLRLLLDFWREIALILSLGVGGWFANEEYQWLSTTPTEAVQEQTEVEAPVHQEPPEIPPHQHPTPEPRAHRHEMPDIEGIMKRHIEEYH